MKLYKQKNSLFTYKQCMWNFEFLVYSSQQVNYWFNKIVLQNTPTEWEALHSLHLVYRLDYYISSSLAYCCYQCHSLLTIVTWSRHVSNSVAYCCYQCHSLLTIVTWSRHVSNSVAYYCYQCHSLLTSHLVTACQ